VFAPDWWLVRNRTEGGVSYNQISVDRLRGSNATSPVLVTHNTGTEYNTGSTIFSMDGINLDSYDAYNKNTISFINYFFKRAPGVFDVVCYTGTGSNKTETHNLGVAPELWIVKGRSGTTDWIVGCTSLANTEYLVINTTAAKATDATAWNSTFPTSTVLSLGTQAAVNTNAATYVAYLFASKPGISKVGSYTGNGSALTLDMGFSGGARFFMAKRTDSTGDWFVWDSARGIIAGNDPHLSLNTTVAEVTTDDSVDPTAAGIIVNELAATHINVNGATYIYLAFA